VQLSIVLPCYHPPQDWEQRVLQAYRSLAERLSLQPELIIVDDGGGSGIDDPLQVLAAALPGLQTVRYAQNRGKGFALRQGVQAASGALIIYTDIDFPYSEASFQAIYDALQGGNDVAIGVKDAAYYRQVPPLRRIISKRLRGLIRTFMRLPITDTQCGLKGMRAAVRPVFLSTTIDRYLFDLEFVYNCFRRARGLRVQAVPVSLRPGVVFRSMNYRVLSTELLNFIRIMGRRGNR
jgi:glycosyltransferase involved in cell wall biosynthesis